MTTREEFTIRIFTSMLDNSRIADAMKEPAVSKSVVKTAVALADSLIATLETNAPKTVDVTTHNKAEWAGSKP